MTPEERQELREKHKCCSCGYCLSDECYAGCVGDYPCDLIKVLDAWEAERKAIVDALSHGHHEMAEIVDEIASVLFRAEN